MSGMVAYGFAHQHRGVFLKLQVSIACKARENDLESNKITASLRNKVEW